MIHGPGSISVGSGHSLARAAADGIGPLYCSVSGGLRIHGNAKTPGAEGRRNVARSSADQGPGDTRQGILLSPQGPVL
ncbi:hypothetical protein UCMB321_2963 [Pseudomonas batumici]|uniref:Uncharacterized protein n=1 Tax=Pseudomonas batumici TaxID=226910 RepID=A0A0C2IEA0_9PSED|nr:hypothetical protein UCMB321_2963 [Pseudomonas batumici]